jgi:hypothetical protein
MNLWDYILALNKAAAGKSETTQPTGQPQGPAPTTGVEPKPSPWTLFFGDLLNLAQAQWAPAGWVPFKFGNG